MSIAAVAHRHVFGLKGDVKDNIAYLDEQTVLYPAGSNAILYNTETKTQKFIPVTDRCEGITAMAVAASKRNAAIAERGVDKPVAVIYDLHTLRRRKALVPPDGESKALPLKEFVCMAFSSDAKYIVTQTGAPDWMLHYWTWEKTKLMASVRTASFPQSNTLGLGAGLGPGSAATPNLSASNMGIAGDGGAGGGKDGLAIYQVSFNPLDNTQLCVVGNGVFKLFRYSEGSLKPFQFQKVEPRNFLCHCWTLDERIIVGTEDGRLLVFETNGEPRMEIPFTFGPNPSNQVPKACNAILSYSKGFVAAGSGGNVVIFEKSEDTGPTSAAAQQAGGAGAGAAGGQKEGGVEAGKEKEGEKAASAAGAGMGAASKELYKRVKDFVLPDEVAKVLNMAMSPSEDNLLCSLENSQMFAITLASAEGDEAKFEIFSQPFHHGQITGMDTCIRKPLIATCSSDRSVRVWNYVENSSELVKYFPEEAYSVAIHPSGLYILVGFSDKLRLMNLLIDDIRTFREFTVRGCRECRFSNGGQHFAAVHGNTIQIYSTWNFENLGNLKGHNGKVRSIYWSPDDSKIVSAGMDGAIYDWALRDLSGMAGFGVKREGESILKSCSYTSAVATPDGRSIFAVGSDKTLKEIIDSQIVRELESDTVLTQVVMSHSGRMMFVGTANGTVRSMKFPLGNEAGEYQEHQGHSGPITKLRVSYDDQFLFSTSEDGSLYVFKISDKEGRGLKKEREIVYADEILVTKSDLEEKNQMMAELKTRVEELKMENEYQLRLKDMNFNEKIKEVTEKFMQEIEALKITSTVLRTDKEKEEVRHEEEMSEERERHARDMLELESIHNTKLMAEYEKYQELQLKTQELQSQWERQMRDMQVAKERSLNELTNHFEAKLKERQLEIDQLQEEMKRQIREFEGTTREAEEDADSEILELKHRYERKLKEEREVGLRLKGENGIMRKKFNTLQNEIDGHKAEIAKMYAEEKKLHSVIKSLEKDIAGLKKEIQERDETIQDKEKRIYDLKKKNQELEKFKFVLDYKIKELKRQIEPRERDIQGMTQQIKEMDVELEHYNKANSNLELAIADLKLKLKAAEKEVSKERSKIKACAATVKRFKVDLNECVQYIQEPKQLKASVKKLYQKYCKEAIKDEETIEVDVQQEYARQREYLERTVASLRRKVLKDQGIHRTDNVRIMQENVALIKEINQLRKDLRAVRQKEKAAEMALNHPENGERALCYLSQSHNANPLPSLDDDTFGIPSRASSPFRSAGPSPMPALRAAAGGASQ
ncbi:Cilia- and flagella-associated protein 57 [Phlyctochytrium bullatum]|nr:Cilia- and flagella-associated protein 57 [Phlyctochytrium bullatum]